MPDRIWRLLGNDPKEATMTTTTESPIETPIDEERLGSFAGRMIEAAVASAELTTIELGRDLGLYTALRAAPLSPPELAEAAGIHPRTPVSGSNSKPVAGILDVALDGDVDAPRLRPAGGACHCTPRRREPRVRRGGRRNAGHRSPVLRHPCATRSVAVAGCHSPHMRSTTSRPRSPAGIL